MTPSADVVVIGAGALGAACAYFAAREGFTVHVVERAQIAFTDARPEALGDVVALIHPG